MESRFQIAQHGGTQQTKWHLGEGREGPVKSLCTGTLMQLFVLECVFLSFFLFFPETLMDCFCKCPLCKDTKRCSK